MVMIIIICWDIASWDGLEIIREFVCETQAETEGYVMGLQICHSDTAENQPGDESVDYKQDNSMLKRSTKTGYIDSSSKC